MLVQQNPVAPAVAEAQPHMAPFQAACRPVNVNIGSQPEITWGLPPPPILPAYQPQNKDMRTRERGPNARQGLNPTI